MYFTIKPKTKKEDLFNFEEEYLELKNEIIRNSNRIIVVSGLRRTGKTSLMNVVYNEMNLPKVYMDSREIFPFNPSAVNQHFISILNEFLKKYDLSRIILDHIKSVDFMLKIEPREKEVLLSSLLKNINEEMKKRKTHLIIFIDEAQLLKPTGFDRLIAYIYDNLINIQICMAGSEIGIMEEFIGKEKDAPLYGRAKKRIYLGRLKPEESLLFLKQGFKQAKKDITEDELISVIKEIDGLVGWLSMYGWYSLESNSKGALETVLTQGSKIVLDELNAFLKNRNGARNRYLAILKSLKIRPMGWSEIKTSIELEEKKEINDSHVYNYLESLMGYGFIEKEDRIYKLSDPLLRKGLEMI